MYKRFGKLLFLSFLLSNIFVIKTFGQQRPNTIPELENSLSAVKEDLNLGNNPERMRLALFAYEASFSPGGNLLNPIEHVRQQRSIERLFIAITVIILLLIIIVAVLIYRNHRRAVVQNGLLKAQNDDAMLQYELIKSQNEVLSQVNRDHNRLFSIIGHDLRSPFASIKNTLELFKAGHLDHREVVTLSEKLGVEIRTASSMLDSLLLWSVNQMGGIRSTTVKIDLEKMVGKVIDVFLPAASLKNIRLEHDKSNLLSVLGDADQVGIMIYNLISNAVKFTPEHGQVKIFYKLSSDYLDLIVQDNGIGMSTENMELILRGEHAHSPTYGTNNEKGIGLGLYLVKDFAANNGILFTGHSTLGEGSRFILRFHQLAID